MSLGPQTDIPCLGQITEAASFQELEPPVLTPCPMPGLNAHSSKKHRQQNFPQCSLVDE